MGLSIKTFLKLALVSLILLEIGSGHESYQDKALKLHNDYRAKHSAAPLILDNALSQNAIRCAQHYFEIGKLDHSCPYKGELIENSYKYQCFDDFTMADVAGMAAKFWYEEKKKYDPENPKSVRQAFTFTAMVWKKTKRLGFGMHKFSSEHDEYYVVALYDPPGNVAGKFKENVQFEENQN